MLDEQHQRLRSSECLPYIEPGRRGRFAPSLQQTCTWGKWDIVWGRAPTAPQLCPVQPKRAQFATMFCLAPAGGLQHDATCSKQRLRIEQVVGASPPAASRRSRQKLIHWLHCDRSRVLCRRSATLQSSPRVQYELPNQDTVKI